MSILSKVNAMFRGKHVLDTTAASQAGITWMSRNLDTAGEVNSGAVSVVSLHCSTQVRSSENEDNNASVRVVRESF